MLTFIFISCLVAAALLTRIHPTLCIPPLVIAYLIARFTNFNKVSDRECMGMIAFILLAATAFFAARSWL